MATSISQGGDSFVLRDLCIFTGDSFIEAPAYVVVKEGKILDVGSGDYPVGSLGENDSIPVISRPGSTLLPGLIDSHIHALGGNTYSIEQSLRFGVTTVCDMHNEPGNILKLKDVSPSNK
jgi:imidazolonepropionase-like amidohydrolase